jgi:hypothetical protein
MVAANRLERAIPTNATKFQIPEIIEHPGVKDIAGATRR